jgi:hypothetical protein
MNMYRKYAVNNLKGYSVVQDANDVLVLQRDSLGKTIKQYLKTIKK